MLVAGAGTEYAKAMRSTIVGLICLVVGLLGALGYSHYFGEGRELAELRSEVAKLQAELAKSNSDSKQAHSENEALAAQVVQLDNTKDDLKKKLAAAQSAGAPAPAAPANPFATPAMVGMMKARFAQQREQRLAMLKARLHLTPEQEAEVKAAMDEEGKLADDMAAKFMAGEKVDMKAAGDLRNMKSVDQALDTVLTPDQKTAYQQMKTDEKNSAAEMSASVEMNQVSPMLGLNDTQKDQVESALYQVQLQPPDPGAASNPVAVAEAREKAKEDALAKILTPDQLATYRQQAQSQLQMQQAMMQRFMPQAAGNAPAPAPATPSP
jgi:hypothetical protein